MKMPQAPKGRQAPVHSDATPVPPVRGAWLVLALVIITGAVFGRVIANDFTWWDDHETIHQNPDLNPPSAEKIAHYWRRPHMGLYVPVTYTVWGAVASVAYVENPWASGIRLIPAVFHAASVLVHIVTGVAVFSLLRRLIKHDIAAFVGALVFALHPVQVEPVAWTSGMKDLLYGCFSMLALWCYVGFVQGNQKTEDRSQKESVWGWYLVGTGFFVLALLSKPSGVMVPAIAGIVDWLVLRRGLGKVIFSLAPWGVLSFVVAVVAKWVQTASHLETTALWLRPMVALDAIAFYVYKVLFPFALAPDYGRRPEYVVESGWLWVSWLAPAALAGVLWKWREKLRWGIAGFLILIAAVLPVLGLVPFEFQGYSTVADHYLYLAMLGPAMIVAWIISRWGSAKVLAGAAIVLGVYAVVSVAQAGQWQNDRKLWSQTLKVNPRSWLAAHNLGVEYGRQGRPQDAGQMYELAVSLNPEFLNSREAYAAYLLSTRRDAAGIEQLKEFVRLAQEMPAATRPNLARQYNGLGEALMRLGKNAEAAAMFEKAIAELNGGEGSEMVKGNLARARAATTRPGA